MPAQFSKAEGHYRKALEADPKYALAHFNIANLYDERGDYDRALRHYQEAVGCIPVTPTPITTSRCCFRAVGT